jgi:hypothetical protein
VVSLACLFGICLRLLQDPKIVAALASNSHTDNGGKARGRKDTDKGGGQRPRSGQRASSSATSAPKASKASIQFFCGKRDMAPALRACSTQSAVRAHPAVVQHIEEIPSHAAAQARQQGVSGRSGVRYASLSKAFKPYHTADMSSKAAASLLMSISSCMLTAQRKPMIVKIVLAMLWRT